MKVSFFINALATLIAMVKFAIEVGRELRKPIRIANTVFHSIKDLDGGTTQPRIDMEHIQGKKH